MNRQRNSRKIMAGALLAMVASDLIVVAARAEFCTFYVAVDGNDAWSGTLRRPNAAQDDGPFATLFGARDAIRQRRKEKPLSSGGVRVEVGDGKYLIDRPLEFAAEDSGNAQARITYRAATSESVRLIGGTIVNNWRPVTDTCLLEKLDESARGQVVQADLKVLGITEFGSPDGSGIELFFDGQPMRVSRWPNEGFVQIIDVLGKTERNVRGVKGCAEGLFEYEGDRPSRWVGEPDAWVHGYWFWDWSEQRHKIRSIDIPRRLIEVQPPYHSYGYRTGQWFYAFNLLAELDQPGEWYLDRERGVLYFWPPSAVEQGEAIVSVQSALVTMTDVSNVTLQGFTLEAARGTAVTVSGGAQCRLFGCTFRNVGGWGVTISDGHGHAVAGCDVYQVGAGGISLNGGDRTTLTAAEHLAENNHVHDFARVNRVYQPGVQLQGVGNRAAHNLIHDAPHMAIGFGGNDHRIEFNEIHHVCTESNDAGAIYTGRNWTMRGTIIRHNFLHDITGFRQLGCVGVYLDDMFCGTEISGNLFVRVTNAAFVGGGRDCIVKNNLFIDCNPALHIDGRALGWAHEHSDEWIKEARDTGTLSGIHYRELPYKERYPGLFSILNDEPAAPRGNRVTCNVSFGGKWDDVTDDARAYQTVENNLIDVDPLFSRPDRIGSLQPRAVDFELQPDSPAWEIGFQKLPLDRIGLDENSRRTTLQPQQ